MLPCLFCLNFRVRFGLMVWTWGGTGQPGALNRPFMSQDPCSAPLYQTTSQCWSWRGHQRTYGLFLWTGLSSVALLESLNRALSFFPQHSAWEISPKSCKKQSLEGLTERNTTNTWAKCSKEQCFVLHYFCRITIFNHFRFQSFIWSQLFISHTHQCELL